MLLLFTYNTPKAPFGQTMPNCSIKASEMGNPPISTESVNDIKTRDNAKTLLLRLPSEIKTRIYNLVCGGQTIHVKYVCNRPRLFLYPCIADLTEEETQRIFDASKADWSAPETADRHSHCFGLDTGSQEPYTSENNPLMSLETSILRCCKQSLMEAEFVLFSTNTFSFASAESLTQFCWKLPKRYHPMLRSLCLHISVSSGGCWPKTGWEWAFRDVNSSLKHLRRVHIDLCMYPGLTMTNWWGPEELLSHQSSLLCGILELGKLDLRSATVVLWDVAIDSTWTFQWDPLQRWTLAQKQEWSQYLRRALLHYENREVDLAKVKRRASEEGRICRL